MSHEVEDLGTLVDRLDNLTHALRMPLQNDLHVSILREALPKLVKDFKIAYAKELGQNPWEGQPE